MRRALILAHYDVDGIVDPYVIEAMNVYRRFADILVLVSASAVVLPAELRDVVDHFIPRQNVGYDFGSWKAGWQSPPLRERFDEIVFVNDSVYGPLFDGDWQEGKAACSDADYWGMVLSKAHSPHLQSWFAVARRPVIEFPGFGDFWDSTGADMPKNDMIRQLEIGLSSTLMQHEFTLAAVYDGRDAPMPTCQERVEHVVLSQPLRSLRFLKKTAPWRGPFDPSLLFYKRLWQAGVPFLKRRLLEVNPYALDLARVRRDLYALSPRWHALMEQHQDRLASRGNGRRQRGQYAMNG